MTINPFLPAVFRYKLPLEIDTAHFMSGSACMGLVSQNIIYSDQKSMIFSTTTNQCGFDDMDPPIQIEIINSLFLGNSHERIH
jgi:hypothetical protein